MYDRVVCSRMVRSGVNEESLQQYRQGLLGWMGINAQRERREGVCLWQEAGSRPKGQISHGGTKTGEGDG